jgi:hypothetical protein
MLALTRDAARAVDRICSQAEASDGAGLRISRIDRADRNGGGGTDLRLALVESPPPGDRRVEGAPVYVEPSTAELLDDKLLDADLGDGRIRFRLFQQAPDGSVAGGPIGESD